GHILHYYLSLTSYTTPSLPQFSVTAYVDGREYGRYNSETRRCQAFHPSLNSLSDHLEQLTKYAQTFEVFQRNKMNFLMDYFNKTYGYGNIHVFQRKFACELHDDGTIDGYEEFAMDNQEIVTLDRKRSVFVPVTKEAFSMMMLWNKDYCDANNHKSYMENECIQHLKLYLPLIEKDLNKKVHPSVKISDSVPDGGLRLRCLVYGFYPRDVEVKWVKNGRDEVYPEESPQILPNPDGTFQIRVSVEVTPEEGDRYSCHVDHGSLDNTLVIPYEPKDRNISHIAIPPIVVALLLAVVLGIFIHRRRSGILHFFFYSI
ncbi:hypothetical protein GDO86_016556, partial [Hymenochirus boettgeri]